MKRFFFLLSLLVSLNFLAACQPPTAAVNEVVTEPTTAGTHYPVMVESCGRTLTFTDAPTQVFVDYQTQLELMLRLGLGDKIAAYTGFGEVPLAADVVDAFAQMEGTATPLDAFPTREQAVSASYDLAMIAFPSYVYDASQGRASREEWEQAGTQLYESNADCADGVADRTLDDSFQQIRDLGQIFNVADRAEALVAEMEATLAMVESAVAGRPQPKVAILDYIDDNSVPYFYAAGIYTDLIERAGGENVFADQSEQYVAISPEVVAARPVDVLLVTQWAGGISAEEKAEYYFSVFPNAPVAQSRRIAVLTNMELNAGSGNAMAVEKMARVLHPEAFVASDAAPEQATYPVTVENCGNTLTFDQAPARVASLYSVTTELLLRLGLEDHIVAAANFGEPLPEDLQPAYQGLNLIGQDFVIPREVLLSQKPDLVMDNQPDWFYSAENGFATVEEITGAGAQIYSITAKCGGGRVDAQFEDIYTDIRNMGQIFGVSDRAEALIAEMQATVDAVTAKVAGQAPLQVMIYDAGEGPLGVFGPGAYDAILRLVGGENAFADLKETYAQVSIEAVASRAIDVVIVGGYNETGEARADFIRQSFPNMAAVMNDRVVVIEYGLMNPGVRNHLGVEAFAQALYPEVFE